MAEAVWRSPGRVNLIGEHTDYNDGFVLPLAIQFGCTATVTDDVPDDVLRVSSGQRPGTVRAPLDELAPGSLAGADTWAGYVVGVVWSLRRRGHQVGGLGIHVDGDVPPGAGLSSSAALECAVAAAVADLAGLELTLDELVAVARHAENDFVGAPTGGMDQLASVFGQPGHALLCDMRSLAVEPIPFDPATAGLALLVVDTRAPHQLTDGLYGQRRDACSAAARELDVAALRDVDDLDEAMRRLSSDLLCRRARHVITENRRTLACADLLRAGQIRGIGPVLDASQASMRDDFEITVPEVDLAVDILLDAGAVGARMTGGGFGGCVIALIDDDRAEAAARAVREAFAARGYDAPTDFRAIPSAGVQRLTEYGSG